MVEVSLEEGVAQLDTRCCCICKDTYRIMFNTFVTPVLTLPKWLSLDLQNGTRWLRPAVFCCVWGCVGIQLRRSVMQWRGTTIFMPINGQTAVVHFFAKRRGWVREGLLRDLQPLHWLPVTSHQEPALYCWNVYDAEDVFCRFCLFCQIHRKFVAHDIKLPWCVGRRARWTNAQWDVHAKVKLATGHLYVRAPRKAQVDVVSTRIDLKTVHVS